MGIFLPPFYSEEVEIEEIDNSYQSKAEEHQGITGQLENNAHDGCPDACPEIGKSGIGPDGWSMGRTREIDGVSHQSGIEKGITQPPDQSD
jgi:hypothetical protein